MVKKAIQISGIIIGVGSIVSLFILLNSLYPRSSRQPVQAQTSNLEENLQDGVIDIEGNFREETVGDDEEGIPNSIFAPRIPFGGEMEKLCFCSCTLEVLVRVNSPSRFRWPFGQSEKFKFGGYTYKHIKDFGSVPDTQTIGMAVPPKSLCLQGPLCVPCGKGPGYPILYVGESGGSIQPTGSTKANPWVPPF